MSDQKTGREFPTLQAEEVYEIAGGYPVIRVLGEGGMGRVYACRDQALGRVVAVKVMKRDAADDEQMVARFVREARAMARVSSPHVVSIFDVGGGNEEQGPPWIVMEYLDGEDLESRLRRTTTVPVARTLDYMRDAARGLRAANQAGLVHRDVKPANLIVADGRVVLTDFGLAKPVDGSADVTKKGVIAGSPHFMPPERIRGDDEDHRSDIYSLGATWFMLLTGRPPFERETPVATVTAHLSDAPPDLKALLPELPGEVTGCVHKMLAKDPKERFQTYDELLEALDQAAQKVDPSALPQEPLPPKPANAVEARAAPATALFKTKLEDASARMSGAFEKAIGPSWKKHAARAAAVLVGVALALVFALGGEEDPLERIDAGEAALVLEEIAKKPIGERVPGDDLLRGHAHAKLGQDKEAFAAYAAAAGKGESDERALDFVLARLNERHADAAIKLLTAWPDERVTPKLHALLDEESWWPRHHALFVLKERGEDGDVDRVRLALLDLEKGETCGARRYGLRELKEHAKGGEEVLKAIEAAAAREDNDCMTKEIGAVKKAVAERK